MCKRYPCMINIAARGTGEECCDHCKHREEKEEEMEINKEEIDLAWDILSHGARDLGEYCRLFVKVRNAYRILEKRVEELENDR